MLFRFSPVGRMIVQSIVKFVVFIQELCKNNFIMGNSLMDIDFAVRYLLFIPFHLPTRSCNETAFSEPPHLRGF